MGIPACDVVNYQEKIREEQSRLNCLESYFNYAIDEEHIERAVIGIKECEENLARYWKQVRRM